jgi:hypothetical protein
MTHGVKFDLIGRVKLKGENHVEDGLSENTVLSAFSRCSGVIFRRGPGEV